MQIIAIISLLLVFLNQCKTSQFTTEIRPNKEDRSKIKHAQIIQGGILLQYTSPEDEKEIPAMNETLATQWQNKIPQQKSLANKEFYQHFNKDKKQQLQNEFSQYLDFSQETRDLLQSKLPNLRYIFFLSVETGKEQHYRDFVLHQSYNTPTGVVYERHTIAVSERNVTTIPVIYDIQEGKIIAASTYQRIFRQQKTLSPKEENSNNYPKLVYSEIYQTMIETSLQILP